MILDRSHMIIAFVVTMLLSIAVTGCQSNTDFRSNVESTKIISETPSRLLEPEPITATKETTPTAKKFTATPTSTMSLIENTVTPDEDPYFSLVNANTTPPQDIIQEIMYFGGAGGGYCDRMVGESEYLEISVCPNDVIELMGLLRLTVTGVESGDAVTLTITYPDNNQLIVELTADSGGYITYDYIPEITDQTGEYIFYFQTPKGNIQQVIRVIQPAIPRLYLVPEEKMLILYNFSPNEHIRLFYYGSTFDSVGFKAWKSYQTDDQGSISIKYTDLEDPLFVAVGDITGQVTFQEKGEDALEEVWAGGDVICPGAPPPLGIRWEDNVMVTTNIIAKIENYEEISYTNIPAGTKLQIDFNWTAPICENESIWWPVCSPAIEGFNCGNWPYVWIPEGYGDIYFIQKY